jgi:hypothetical protein
MRIHPGARVLLAAVGAVGVWAACTGGLKLDEGNAFPCDFREPEEVRDLQCPPSWRCGIDGRCQDGEAEQPGLKDPPEFQSERRFPRRLDGDTRFIAGDPFFAAADPQRADLVQAFVTGDQSGKSSLAIGPFSLPIFPNTQVETLALLQGQLVVKDGASGPLKLYSISSDLRTTSAARTVTEPPSLPSIRALRVPMPSFEGALRPALAVVREDGGAGEVDLEQAVYTPFPPGFALQTDGGVQPCAPSGPMACATPDIPGDYKDARLIGQLSMVLLSPGQDPGALASESAPVAVTPTRFLWRSQAPSTGQPLGQWQLLNPGEVLSDTAGGGPPQSNWRMRHSAMGGVWAVARTITVPRPPGSGGEGPMQQDVLSTWTLLRSPARPREPRLERSWSDCSPCGTDRLVTFTPVSDGALGVEVLCESETTGTRALFRVTGASVVSPLDTCLRQPLTAPFDLSELAKEQDGERVRTRPYAVDDARGGKLVLGGAHGQIWFGDLLSQLQPAFLDRAPVAVTPYQGVLLAFTRDFFAVGPFDRQDARLPRGEGLFVQPPRRPGEQDAPGLGNVVEGIPGWFLLETGQILRATFDTNAGVNLSNTYGPRLLGPSGETATGPYLGQGTPAQDGVSLVIAANDQLYYKELKLSELNPDPSRQEATLNPQLTPEPGFPVRSLARDGNVSLDARVGVRVRGWVATSRSAFKFEQDAETKAWSLTKLPLGDGEPVKVWTREAEREGEKVSFGRLGLRDGQVLRLPQGLPITQPLPVQNPRVVDYASLKGWPVALEERGIYRTIPSPDSPEGLMRWQPLALPAGLTVDDLKDARIAVVKQDVEVLYLFTRTGSVYQLSK